MIKCIMSTKKFLFCNNCGKYGHMFHRCKKPITSMGIVLFRIVNGVREYVMICRRHSLGYVDFMRGKYPLSNRIYLENIIYEMTNSEKALLLSENFDTLWHNLWGEFVGCQYRGEERSSKEKFSYIKRGTHKFMNGEQIKLDDLIKKSKSSWDCPEWGFPKGRRNYQENDLTCAFREFEEETGFFKGQLNLFKNVIPFEEIFTGSNMRSYKHKYFLAYIKNTEERKYNFQETEVSQIKWMTLEECLQNIRPYNLEKKEMIKNIDKVLSNYRLIL